MLRRPAPIRQRLTRPLVALLVALLAAPVLAAPDPLQPAGSGGLPEVARALDHLSQHRRLMVIGAHPDDEDTTLLALVSLAQGGEAAYLSLSRGEGGQNLIGPELGPSLGVLRSEELLAARRLDGARQLFTRAYDFGFTDSLEETLSRWPREGLLVDVVRAIRRFRPQVVVAVFPPDERAGHGQHQASGVVAEEAVRMAGDALAFPQLDAEGLPPWQPEAFYREAWWNPEAATLQLPSTVIDPLTGHTVFQIAMAGRSRHRSQSMGQLQDLDGRPVRLSQVTATEGGAGLFGGIDTSLAALARLLPAGVEQDELRSLLAAVEGDVAAARRGLAPDRLGAAVAPLGSVMSALRQASTLVAASPSAATADGRHLAALLAEKEEAAGEALAAAAGLVLDATTGEASVVPGGSIPVTVKLWNGGTVPLRVAAVTLLSPAGWSAPVSVALPQPSPPLAVPQPPLAAEAGAGAAPGPSTPAPAEPIAEATAPAEAPGTPPAVGEVDLLEPVPPPPPPPAELAPGALLALTGKVEVDAAAAPTVPYFLERPLLGDLYDWEGAPAAVRGEPFEPPPLLMHVELELASAAPDTLRVTLDREVAALAKDLVRGEVRRPLRLVPEVEVAVAQGMLPWPLADHAARTLQVTLGAHGAPRSGQIGVRPPAGWPEVPPVPFQLSAGERRTFPVRLVPPEELVAGRGSIAVDATTAEGKVFLESFPLIDYEHVRPRPVPVPSRVAISAFPLALPRLGRVGYVRGAADEVPEALAAVGLPVEVIPPTELLARDLLAYDALVVGSRAYDATPELAAANPRLLDFVRQGGLLVVQFQRADYFAQRLAPLPLAMERGNATRTTDETAPVRLLAPDHPVFATPNSIEASDWEGWVQERGLYYPQTWDPAYVPLLAMADPGKPELLGSLLVAPYGQGTFVYTGLAFFRQLPAGVPGAYRLFANLLALAKPRVQSEDLPEGGR